MNFSGRTYRTSAAEHRHDRGAVLRRVIVFSLFISTSVMFGQSDRSVFFVPDTQFVPSLTASGTEHRMSYAKRLNNASYDAGLGGSFPAALVRYNSIECLIIVAGTVYTTLESAGIKYLVTNADYYADILFDIPLSPSTTLRLGSGHTSHHLVDDAVIALGQSRVINYARDYYQLFVVRSIEAIGGFTYAGLFYNHSFLLNTRRGGQLLFQCGADGGNLSIAHQLELYGAVDLKFRSEVNYGSTQSYQAGLRARGTPFRAVRIAYTYRTGMDDRGQFYDQRKSYHSIGLYFDF